MRRFGEQRERENHRFSSLLKRDFEEINM